MVDDSVINDHISINSDRTDAINLDGDNGFDEGGSVDANLSSKVPYSIDQLEVDSQHANVTQHNVTYGGFMNNLTTLARTVQNSQVESKKVFSVINEWLDKLQRKEQFDIECVPLRTNVATKSNIIDIDKPLHATAYHSRGLNKRKRLKSIYEKKGSKNWIIRGKII